MTATIGFILEQALGHVTHSQNLMHCLSGDPSIRAQWGLPAYEPTGMGKHFPLYRSNWTVRAGLQTRRMLTEMQRRDPPDVLFFHTQVTATLAQDWLVRIPSVVSLDATPLQYDALGDAYTHQSGPAWFEAWKYRLNRDCFSKARRIVTWSTWTRAALAEYETPPEKVTVIPPGVNLSDWTPPAQRPPHSSVRILFVGGDLERKGGLDLLEAFRCLRAELLAGKVAFPEIELHLVTRVPVDPEPGVFVYNQMQPNTPELRKLYFDSDIFCLPTHGDCLPLSLAEAGAAGLPLVSTRVGAIEEIVQEGKTGFTIAPRNVQALVAVLRRLVVDGDLRRSMGNAARELVQKDHNAATNAARLLNLLKETAEEGRLPRRAR